MVAQLIGDANGGEIALAAVACVASGLVPILLLSWMLGSCIGLRSAPLRRAALTVGLAYLATLAIMAVLDPGDFSPLFALLPLPGALAVFVFRQHLDRKACREGTAGMP